MKKMKKKEEEEEAEQKEEEKKSYPFNYLILSNLHSWALQRQHSKWYLNRLKTEADKRIHLPFIKEAIEEMYINISNTFFLTT